MSALFARPARLVFALLICLVCAAAWVGQTGPAFAQATTTEGATANRADGVLQPEDQMGGRGTSAELWRKVREGDRGTVAGENPQAGVMIQSGGDQWRAIRNGPLPRYSAWAILGTLMLLALFFALRGRIRIEGGKSTRVIERFSLIERVGHWLLASSFILLALTGLNITFGKTLLMPLLGKEAFAALTIFGKTIHNYVAFAFILGLVMITVMWILQNIPNRHDVMWLLRGGGMFGGGHPPAKKFNAGQKIVFWAVVLCGISISMSGWALMSPFTTNMFGSTFGLFNSVFGTSFATDLSPIAEQQYQSIWHAAMAVFMTVIILGHIYIGTIGMEGAIDAMTTGDVDANWAHEHHALWAREVGPDKVHVRGTDDDAGYDERDRGQAPLQPAE